MGVPKDVEIDREAFVLAVTETFPCDRTTAEKLVPMVASLRGLARHVSEIVREPEVDGLSESATGD